MFRVAVVGASALAIAGCFGRKPTAPQAAPLKDEIPAHVLSDVLKAHSLGAAHMDRYEYAEAVEQFRKVHNLAPGWIAGAINLAIAQYNMLGLQEAKKNEGEPPPANQDRASQDERLAKYREPIRLFDEVLDRDPLNLHAHFCKGILFKQAGMMEEAHRAFRIVAEKDPNDGPAWQNLGATLTAEGGRTVGPEDGAKLREIFQKAVEHDPYRPSTHFMLANAYRFVAIDATRRLDAINEGKGDASRKDELTKTRDDAFQKQAAEMEVWKGLNFKTTIGSPGEPLTEAYGDAGKYAMIIDPAGLAKREPRPVRSPRFDGPDPTRVKLPQGARWAKSEDFKGKYEPLARARERFGAAIAPLDANGDGRTDLYIPAAIVGPSGLRDALLIAAADYAFEDKTIELGLPADRAGLGVAAADFDSDKKIDLFVVGIGDNRLFRNLGDKFEDVTKSSGIGESKALSLTARWLDIDQDGDLDLYVLNHAPADRAAEAFTAKPPAGAENAVYRNDGVPPASGMPADSWTPVAAADLRAGKVTEGLSVVFTRWPDAPALAAGTALHSGIAALDLDQDRDLDLVVTADNVPPVAILNDRLGRFHSRPITDIHLTTPVSGALACDLDRDGKGDLVFLSAQGRLTALLNQSSVQNAESALAFKPFPVNAENWKTALACDLDLDGATDLLGFPIAGPEGAMSPAWAHNEDIRLAAMPLPLKPDPALASSEPLVALAYADMVGDPLFDLIAYRLGEPPRIGRNAGNGAHWLALDLEGKWYASFAKDRMRTNPHSLGASLVLTAAGVRSSFIYTTPNSSLAQSVGPILLGLGDATKIDALRLKWPDAVVQGEFDIPANQKFKLQEFNRKQDSCPVLFTFDGERYVCPGDLNGAGVLGYLVAPGTVAPVDRDEALLIPLGMLKPVEGIYKLVLAEPMDEATYLDHLVLEVVDRPKELSTFLDERFATGESKPSGRLMTHEKIIEYVRAYDLEGVDLTETLRRFDHKTANGFRIHSGMRGIAEEHGITLDFGDRLSGLGSNDRVFLCTPGWVEYSKTIANYAAATAGLALEPPVLERLNGQGKWEVIESHPGHPAGTPRMSAIELTGKLGGGACTLRLRTNLECYWDQAFIAVVSSSERIQATSLPIARAELVHRGFMRERPGMAPPYLYDYDTLESVPVNGLPGLYTRYGDVTELIAADDDRLCVFGPGEEVQIEFDGRSLPPLREGFVRECIVRSVAYCKDADLFSVTGDDVGPLPWKGMKEYPYPASGARPMDEAYNAYLRTYQTRRMERH